MNKARDLAQKKGRKLTADERDKLRDKHSDNRKDEAIEDGLDELEAEFLASLTPEEKKKFLQKNQKPGDIAKQIRQGGKEVNRVKELAGVQTDEETYDGDDFYNNYGDMWYNEDEIMDEAEYQGRKVKLGKPMRGDVKKFKVYVRDPKTKNIKKVNFGDPNMKIKKSNPARRRSFRARHNCDNPGPRTKARYWSCRKW